jgi:hypothetical protein
MFSSKSTTRPTNYSLRKQTPNSKRANKTRPRLSLSSQVSIKAPRRKPRETTERFREHIENFSRDLRRVSDGESLGETSDDFVPKKGRVVVLMFTQLADFDSWELAKFIVNDIDLYERNNIEVRAIGLGTVEAGKSFCKRTRFPQEKLAVTEEQDLYRMFEYSPGFGDALPVKLPGMVKLLLMCAGIGSPGTLKTVVGGYFGSKNKKPVLVEGSNADVPQVRKLMDLTLGKDYLRPFEMATLRLANMTEILNNWDELVCKNDQLLVQRGGAFVLDDDRVFFDHRDAGILGYCDPNRLKEFAMIDGDPKEPFDAIEIMHEACETKNVNVEDVCDAIAACEKSKFEVTAEMLNGEFELIYTTGTNKNKANVNRNGDGTYFPIKAVQSFDIENERIRNGVYVGPIKFFFDGPFVWRQKLKMLEFTFTKCSIGIASAIQSFNIDDGKWERVKAAEEKVSEGQGAIAKSSESSKPGANPFFKFVYADDVCIAARGRGGGLAMWKRIGSPKTDVC